MMLLLTSFLVVALAGAGPAESALDLRQTVRFALEHSPTLQSENYQRIIRELERGNARAKFFPTLDLTSGHGIQTTETKRLTDPWTSQFGIHLTETLYDNGKSITQFKLTDVRQKIAELTVEKTRDSLCLEVASQFYSYSQACKLSELKTKQLALLRKEFVLLEGQYKQGLKLRKDYLRLKGQIQRAEMDERSALNEIEKIAISLKALIGVSGEHADRTFRVDEITSLPPIPTQMPTTETTHEYRIAKLEFSQNPFERDLVQRKTWPEIALSAGLNYQTSGYLGPTGRWGDNAQYGWNVLLTLNYNLWDWGSRRRDAEIAETKVKIAETGLRKATLEVTAKIHSMMVEINRLIANYKVARELVSAEEESYQFIRREYSEGKVSYLDLITSLNDHIDAQVRFYNAHYDLAAILAKYEYYSGRLYETITH